jgi:hypothetical protein
MVFLIAQPTVPKDGKMPNLEPLAEFGDVKVLVEAGDYPSFRPDLALEKISERLANFDAENDYLAWAGGDTLAALITGMVLAERGHRYVRWLRFERARTEGGGRDNNNGKYTPIDVLVLTKDPTKEATHGY